MSLLFQPHSFIKLTPWHPHRSFWLLIKAMPASSLPHVKGCHCRSCVGLMVARLQLECIDHTLPAILYRAPSFDISCCICVLLPPLLVAPEVYLSIQARAA